MVRQTLAAVGNATKDLNFIRLAPSFRECRSVSIDYAVMEKTEKAALVPLDAGWSDVGTWDALFDAAKKDEAGNATRGDTLLQNTEAAISAPRTAWWRWLASTTSSSSAPRTRR